jgi:nitroreductase
MDFFETMEARYSHRSAFTDKVVPDADLEKIVEAGLRAPSGCNAQTTGFIIVTNPGLRASISQYLESDAIKTAPALIIGVTKKVIFDFGREMNFEVEDYGAAVQNVLLAITALGYASCWYDGGVRCGDAHEKIAALLGVGEGQAVRCVLPVGVPQKQGKQAGRKAFEERVVWAR